MEFEPLNEEVNADLNGLQLDPMLQVQRDQFLAEQDAEQTEVEEESAPTGAQAPPQPTQAASTEGAEDQKWPWEEGYDVGDYVRNTAENAFAAQTGMLDFGVDVINKLSGQNFNKLPEFQAQHSQALREISSVVLPTIGLTKLGMGGAAAAHGRVGWSLGNSAFVKWIGTKGVEALAGLGVGAVSSEYEEDNLTGTLKQKWPRQFDFIPDSLATVQGEDTDTKRLKNIYEDLGMGLVTSLLEGFTKLGLAIGDATLSFRRSNRMVGETPDAKKFLQDNAVEFTDDVEQTIERSVLKQEEALDELGYYNLSETMSLDGPVKGVHDVFDFTEIGVRTVDDFGVVGAALDSARIAKNLDTVHGRLGNMISEPALKYALQNGNNAQDIVLGLADQLHKAGRVGMEGASGWKITADDVLEANMDVAVGLFDPRMTKAEVRQVLEPFITRDDSGKEIMAEEGFAMAAKALRGFGAELTSMDVGRAQALLAGSLSGRISDLAEGQRLMAGSPAVYAAREKVIDLMQYVTQLAGSAKYYKNRKMNLLALVKNGFRNIEGYNEASVIGAGEVAERVFKESQTFANSMRQIAEYQPQIMDQFLLAYELTDGRIDTIYKMNQYIHGMTADLGKAIINLDPQVQNKLVAGTWSNIYNSILSAFTTPIQALTGNFGGIISEPIAHFAGAIPSQDWKAIQRGWVAYTSIGETLQRALPYAGDVFMKASKNPESVARGTRLDLLLESEKQMSMLREAAKTQLDQGNPGLDYLVNQIEALNDLGKDPILRFGPNAMTALDGFTGVFNASAEARFKAMDELIAAGKPITKKNVKPIADKYYKQMFDDKGMLNNDAVKYVTDEMALNLDTPLAQSITDITQRLPGFRPWLMFPTTGMNIVDIMAKYNPLMTPFQRDINELAFTPLDQLLAHPEHVDDLLRKRNIDISQMDEVAKANKIADLKYITRGRKAMGGIAVVATGYGVLNGRIRGDGLYDKEAQRAREKMTNWKGRTYMGLDGNWHSYEWLGPLADWVALVANVHDNFDMLGEAALERLREKSAFVLSAAITDRTGLSTLKPLLDMLGGDESAMDRWAGGFLNSLGPLAGQRGEWSRAFSEGLLETETDILSVIANRNRFAGGLDPANRQPYVYSPVTGKKANGYGMMQRLWNAYTPFKVHPDQSEEEAFLEAIEYPITTTFNSKNGVKLLAPEQSELNRIMGEDGYWRATIREVMKDAGDWKSIARLKALRRQGYTSEEVPLEKWEMLHVRLRDGQRTAEDAAYAKLNKDMFAAIEQRRVEDVLRDQAAEQGEVFDPTTFANIRK
jgi:hypothetical protein